MSTTLSVPVMSLSSTCQINAGTFPLLVSYIKHTPTIAPGTGATGGNVNAIIQVNLSITSGTPYTVNVATGLDPFGNAAGMVHVSCIIVENDSTTTGQDFTIGGGTHPVCGSDSYLCQANGGVVFVYNANPGYAVTGGSADTLTITVAAGTSVAGRLTIYGRTA